LAALSAFVPACEWTGVEHQTKPNLPPSVRITDGAAEGSQADYRAEFFWFGSDPDGFVEHFVYAVDDTCLCRHKSLTGELLSYTDSDTCDSLAAELVDSETGYNPFEFEYLYEHPDSIWRRIDGYSGQFNFRASEEIEGADPPMSHNLHSFYIKAVDDRGARSGADSRHFDALTICPIVSIESPLGSGYDNIVLMSPSFAIRWEGRDEDSSDWSKRPVGYQVKLIELRDLEVYGSDSALLQAIKDPFRHNLVLPDSVIVGHADSVTADTYLPTEWFPKIENVLTASIFRLRNLPGGNYAFVVRALDEAGALTPEVAYAAAGEGADGRGNILKITVNPAMQSRPYITVSERSYLGTHQFIASGGTWVVDVPVNVPLHFEWTADASWYGSRVGAFNYALDIPDPACEVCQESDGIGGWAGWGDWSRIPFPIMFHEEDAGEQHILYLRVRDESFLEESETLAMVVMNVVAFQLSRPALWVDDFRVAGIDDCEHDAIMSQIVRSAIEPYLSQGEDELEEWQSNPPAGDCGEVPTPRELKLSQMGKYKLIYWNVSGGESTMGLLTNPDPESELGKNLSIYVRAGGSLIIWGPYSLAAIDGDHFPPNRYIPDLPQFPRSNFGPGHFVWDVLRLRTMMDRSGRGNGPGSQQMHLRCSGLVGLQATTHARELNFPRGATDPTGYSTKVALWYDSWTGRMNTLGWFGGHAMLGNPPLRVAGMDTLYTYVSNSWAWREDDLREVCSTRYLSPMEGKPCAIRFDDPDPLSSQGKIAWFGAPFYIFDENHMHDLRQIMRLLTDWVMEP